MRRLRAPGWCRFVVASVALIVAVAGTPGGIAEADELVLTSQLVSDVAFDLQNERLLVAGTSSTALGNEGLVARGTDGTSIVVTGIPSASGVTVVGSDVYVLERSYPVTLHRLDRETLAAERSWTYDPESVVGGGQLEYAGGRLWFAQCIDPGYGESIVSVALDGSDVRQHAAAIDCQARLVPDPGGGALFVFGFDDSGSYLHRYDVDGTALVRTARRSFADGILDLDVAPDGSRLLVVRDAHAENTSVAIELDAADLTNAGVSYAEHADPWSRLRAASFAPDGSAVILVTALEGPLTTPPVATVYARGGGEPATEYHLTSECEQMPSQDVHLYLRPNAQEAYLTTSSWFGLVSEPLDAAASLTLEVDMADVIPGETVAFSGTLVDAGGAPLGGRTVQVRRWRYGQGERLADVTVGAGGAFTFAQQAPTDLTGIQDALCFQVRWAGDAMHRNAYSAPVIVRVEKADGTLRFRSDRELVGLGADIRLQGQLSYSATRPVDGVDVVIVRRGPDDDGSQVIGTVQTDADGRFHLDVTNLDAYGSWDFYAHVAETAYTKEVSALTEVEVTTITSHVTVSAPVLAVAGDVDRVVVQLVEHPDANGGELQLYYQGDGHPERLVGRGAPDAQGRLIVPVRWKYSGRLRGVYTGDEIYQPASKIERVDVEPVIEGRMRRWYERKNAYHLYRKGVAPLLVFSVYPYKAGWPATVYLERERANWNTIGSVQVELNRDGVAGVVVDPSILAVRANYHLVVDTSGTRWNASTSEGFYFRVTRNTSTARLRSALSLDPLKPASAIPLTTSPPTSA